jgi:SAM-dependent methyltransferase
MTGVELHRLIDDQGCLHAGHVRSVKNGYEVIDCAACGFVHAVPIPNEALLNDFYASKYYQSAKPDYAQQHASDRSWWNMVYGERYERFEQLLGHSGRVLDIGCGPGFFLAHGVSMGWDVEGVEPSEHASEYARQLGVKCLTANFDATAVTRLGKYHVVQINQAIEHIPHPGRVIDLCRSLLEPGGVLCIIAANDFNPLQGVARKIHGITDWWVIPPEHLNYFSLTSLSALMERHNFDIVSETATFPIDLFLLMGDNYIDNAEVGKEAHGRRKNLEFALASSGKQALKSALYKSFSALGLGREIEVIGRMVE